MTLNLALRLGASGPFTPLSISGCQLWLDAADASTFTFSSGSVVSQWNDKSGGGFHHSQGTVANQPGRTGTQNSLATVEFDGVNDFLSNGSLQISSTCSVFAVVKRPGGGALAPIVSGLVNTGFGVNLNGTGFVETSLIGVTLYYAGATTAVPSTGYHVVSLASQSTTASAWVNGTFDETDTYAAATSGSASNAVGALQANGTAPRAVALGEVIVYNSALGTTNRQAVESYLKTKWGTP